MTTQTAAHHHTPTTECRPFSLRRAQLRFLALELVLVAGAVAVVLVTQRHAWSDPWFMGAVLSPVLIVAVAGVARLRNVLHINADGLVVRTAFRSRSVSWHVIQVISISRTGSRRRIGVELEDGDRIVVPTGPLLARWSTVGRRIADHAPYGRPIRLAA